MNDWVRALVDPQTMARRVHVSANEVAPPHLFAVLVMGDFDDFVRVAPRYGLQLPDWSPNFPFTEKVERTPLQVSAVEKDVLFGMLGVLVGRPQVPQELEEYAPLEPGLQNGGRLRAVAAIVRALSLVDNGLIDSAIQVLESAEADVDEPYELALLRLHLAATIELYCPAGDVRFDRAAELWPLVSGQTLEDDSPPVGGVPLHLVIRALAQQGELTAQSRQGRWFLRTDDEDYLFRRLLSNFGNLPYAELGDALLKDQFENATRRSRNTITIFSSGSDKAADILGRGLLRARCSANVRESSSLRRAIARSQIVDVFGTNDTDSASAALQELFDTRDSKGVKRAASLLWVDGPYLALQRVTERAISHMSSPSPADSPVLSPVLLELLRSGLDVVDSESLRHAARFVVDALSRSDVRAVDQIEMTALAGIIAECQVREVHELLSRAIGEITRSATDEESHEDHYIAGLISKINWKWVPEEQRGEVLAWALGSDSSGRMRATRIAVLQELAEVDLSRVIDQLRADTRDSRSLDVAAALWNAGFRRGQLTSEDLEIIEDVALRELRAIQSSAHRGSYSLGFGAEPAGILVRLATYGKRESAWDALVEFLTDPAVSLRDKSTCVSYIAGSDGNLPDHVCRRLRERLKYISSTNPFEQETSSKLRKGYRVAGVEVSSREELFLAISLNALSVRQVLAVTTDLAASHYSQDRLTASRAIRFSRSKSSRQSLLPLALTLSRDADVDVRGSALRTLTVLRSSTGWRAAVIDQALFDATEEPGVLLPLHAAYAIRDIPVSARSPLLEEAVAKLRRHSSCRIQAVVSSLVESEESTVHE
ncbi:hypothetical protein L1857_09230 [Amycolatopsis thermalba]|uniref:HEAT repeat domain-containing protein n=1 Tax=Amycolatopsis thermalba TaxID=944492 RepID=A0ABY4NSF5_9PSEU|nr:MULTISPECIES: hypothetical protein [Amycolatopsis]UQS22986.1 hypothetical protein L1857_09230 [Amycolatopsis thermalba]